MGLAMLALSGIGYAESTTGSNAATGTATSGASKVETPKATMSNTDSTSVMQAKKPKKPKGPKGPPPNPTCPPGKAAVGDVSTDNVIRNCTKNGQAGTKMCIVKSIRCSGSELDSGYVYTESCGECRIGGAGAPATTSTPTGSGSSKPDSR